MFRRLLFVAGSFALVVVLGGASQANAQRSRGGMPHGMMPHGMMPQAMPRGMPQGMQRGFHPADGRRRR